MQNLNLKLKFSKILNILNPQPMIGGLEISNSDLRFILNGKNALISASLKLPVGIIEEGRIKDRNNFKTVLSNLHSQITPRKNKKIYVVVNIPDINVYTQIFDLPTVAVCNIEEAARLNLQMISPSDFSTVYSDWQKIGRVDIDGGQVEILGAFIQNQIIDEFTQCLKETNFVVAAIEFYSLAVARLVSGLKNLADPCLLLGLDNIGLNFILIRNHNLYFRHFASWPTKEERQISLDTFKDLIIRETQKVLNFESKQWPDRLNSLLLINPALEEKISQIIKENFSLSVQKLTISQELIAPDGLWLISNNQLPSLSSDWFGALGSALRGLIPRSKDNIISLASPGTEEEFRQHQIINFVKIWRNIALTSALFILIAFITLDGFLMQTADYLKNQLANFVENSETSGELDKLQEEAKNFNSKIEMALEAKKQSVHWSPFFEKIKNLAGSDIIIDRIFIQSLDTPISFNGRAISEAAVINFKNTLEKDSQFKDINLPLAGINPSGNMFSFIISFRAKPEIIQAQ